MHPKIYGMTKMPKMQKIPNLLLLIGRDHQLVYFTMLSPLILVPIRQTSARKVNLIQVFEIVINYVCELTHCCSALFISPNKHKLIDESFGHQQRRNFKNIF